MNINCKAASLFVTLLSMSNLGFTQNPAQNSAIIPIQNTTPSSSIVVVVNEKKTSDKKNIQSKKKPSNEIVTDSDQQSNQLKNKEPKPDSDANSNLVAQQQELHPVIEEKPFKYTGFLANRILYNHSTKGLKLRVAPSIESDRLARMPYGAKMKTLEQKISARAIRFANINSYWVRVKYRNIEGYAFGGYLSKFPTPKTNSLHDYEKVILQAGLTLNQVKHENLAKTSHSVKNHTLILKNANFKDGFLVARRIFEIPTRFAFPSSSNLKYDIVNDPLFRTKASDKSLEIHRNRRGQVVEMTYFEQGSNWGRKSTIKVTKDKQIQLQVFQFSS